MTEELLKLLREKIVPWACEVVDSWPMDYYPNREEHAADIDLITKLAELLGMDGPERQET